MIARWRIPGFLLLIHILLMSHAAQHLAPAWDEITYPAAGVTQWQTRSIQLNTEHGFLSKLICALPLLALRPSVPYEDASWTQKEEYRFGYEFTFHNRLNARTLIFCSRISAILFSTATAALLFLWIQSIWGTAGGVISLLCYMATPILLSRASLALLDMPMYFFTLLTLRLHARWIETGRLRFASWSGVTMGLAFLCKLPALPLLPALVFLNLYSPQARQSWSRRMKAIGLVAGLAVITLFLLYLPWKGAWPAAKHVMTNLMMFDRILPYYWHGRILSEAPSLLSWAAWAVKAPLCVLLLAIWGARKWQRSGQALIQLRHFVVFSFACLLSVLFFRHAVSTAQFAPLYLAVAGLAGSLGVYFRKPRNKFYYAVATILVLAFADVLRSHPNYLAYFNVLAGGPRQGYQWLGDSDQDWGQSLPALADYMRKAAPAGLLLAYSGAADPRAYGLRYQDFYSPALVTRVYRGDSLGLTESPIYLALGTKVLQSEPGSFQWLEKNRKPLTIIDGCFLIYDITGDSEVFQWIATIYQATRRPSLAAWALKRSSTSQKINQANPSHANGAAKRPS